MGGVFSTKNKNAGAITAQDKAILDLKVQRDKLKQYQKKIQVVIEREKEIARDFMKKELKQRALLALRKKKYQEGLLEKTDAQLMNLEQMVSSIEFAVVEKQVFEGLRKGNEILTSIQKEMKIEDVEKLMQDTEEAIEYQNEISNLLSGALTVEDEESIESELAGLIEMEQDKVTMEIESKMPKVPVAVKGKKKDEKQEKDVEKDVDQDDEKELVLA